MWMSDNLPYKTTKDALLNLVNEYLDQHPDVGAESFGWKAVGDSTLVKRLRQGKDVTTRKLDKILAYIHYYK